MLNFIGYIIASIVFIVIIILVSNFVLEKIGKNMKEVVGGPFFKNLNNFILDEGRKFFPIKNDKVLSVIIIAFMLFVYYLNRKYLLK